MKPKPGRDERLEQRTGTGADIEQLVRVRVCWCMGSRPKCDAGASCGSSTFCDVALHMPLCMV
eukprot:6042-Eustigmatos_ZCMA.PRE.1